jgi:hypothetical protein
MQTLQRLLELIKIEDQARLCVSRSEAQRCIKRAEEVRRQLWGSSQAIHFTTSHQ